MVRFRPGFESYLVSGLLVFFASWLLGGCRWGNHIERAQSTEVTRYYETAPTKLTFLVDKGEGFVAADQDLAEIPLVWAEVMSNPVGLFWKKEGDAVGALFNPFNLDNAITVKTASSSVRFHQENAKQAWDDPNCYRVVAYDAQGPYVPSDIEGVTLAGFPISGKLALNVQMVELYDGDTCPATLQAMSDCYHDAMKCGGVTANDDEQFQLELRARFEPYIRAGLMRDTDIPSIKTLAYQLFYR